MRLRPCRNELDRQLVGPLAIVENEHGRTIGGTQGIQKARQGLNASGLAERFRTHARRRLPPECGGELRERRTHSVGLFAENRAQGGRLGRLRASRRDHLVDNSVEELKRVLSHLVRRLAAQHPMSLTAGAMSEFVE